MRYPCSQTLDTRQTHSILFTKHSFSSYVFYRYCLFRSLRSAVWADICRRDYSSRNIACKTSRWPCGPFLLSLHVSTKFLCAFSIQNFSRCQAHSPRIKNENKTQNHCGNIVVVQCLPFVIKCAIVECVSICFLFFSFFFFYFSATKFAFGL